MKGDEKKGRKCIFFPQLVKSMHIFPPIDLKFTKEPVLPQIGQNWQDVKKDGMCTQCPLYSSYVLIFVVYLYNVHIKVCTFKIFDTGITKKRATKCRNTRTNSFLQKKNAPLFFPLFSLFPFFPSFFPHFPLFT